MLTTTKVFFLLLTTWITWYAIVNPQSRAAPTLETIASLDLNNPTTYLSFITNIRTKVADKTEQCTIQKISKTFTQRYSYIDLIVSSTQKITLAIDMADLYVLGYSDIANNKGRAFFFKDVTEAVANNFFPGATGTNRIKLTFTGSYGDLEKNGGLRKDNPLGIFRLENSIVNIYGKAGDVKKQAKFFLLAIQMVSEAARFKYISDKIPSEKYEEVTVDEYMTALENNWAKLSTAVYNSKPSTTTATKCQLATSPVTISPWIFKTVEEIKLVMGLLKSS
uniref:Antiviral protein MAP n=1 Tax=Mirabilis jalapa TaxID=3538 RepID=RIPP_MIRJA|nr:RecName: Full=Antiviral protein MAP; AltName: Full=MAP-S; AltName: Full=Ribosome-inactivating protein; AltName: Full=rRNA N-glycosidase; Flags: Precursor [Mirabilis jalapa]UHY43689.1 antiviral protein [Mirabilis jalapa]BAA01425.1 antiviral protein [Mirabilis jalapa]